MLVIVISLLNIYSPLDKAVDLFQDETKLTYLIFFTIISVGSGSTIISYLCK